MQENFFPQAVNFIAKVTIANLNIISQNGNI